jgi:hypothetical protein
VHGGDTADPELLEDLVRSEPLAHPGDCSLRAGGP